MKKLAALLPVLILSGCQAPDLRAVPVTPAFPPAPVSLSRQPGDPMLPDLKCLQETAQPCRGGGW